MDTIKGKHYSTRRFRDALHHGTFILSLAGLTAAGWSGAVLAQDTPPPAQPAPTPDRLATVDEVQSGFRRGLFIQVAEEGGRLLEREPEAAIKGPVAVALAAQGELENAVALLQAAAASDEPAHALHRSLLSALTFRSRADTNGEEKECLKAIQQDAAHPVAHLFLAEAAYQRKEYAEALQHTEKALTLEPKMAPAFLVRGMIFRAQQKTDEAFRNLNNASVLDPRDLRPRLAMAELAQALRNYELAARLYRETLALKPDMPTVRERFLTTLVESGQMAEARAEAARVLEESPNSAPARVAAARVQAWFDNLPEAVAHLRPVLKSSPADAALAGYLTGLVELGAGNIEAARQALEKLQTSATFKGPALGVLGVLHHGEGRLPAAVKALEQAMVGAPAPVADRLRFHLGMVALDNKKWDEARKHLLSSGSFVINLEPGLIAFEKFYSAGPPKNAAQTSAGALFLAEKMPATAGRFFRKAAAGNGSDVLALYIGANAAAQRLEFDDASRQLKALLTVMPDYWPGHYAAGSVEISRQQLAPAIPHFAKVVEQTPQKEIAHLQLIGLYRQTGQDGLAETACLDLIDKIPGSPVGYNELAALLTEREDAASLATALEVATRAVELKPDDGNFLDTLGWVQFKLKQLDPAIETLRKAVALLPGNPEVQYHLGAALFKGGKPAEADSHLRIAATRGQGSDVAKQAAALITEMAAAARKDAAGPEAAPPTEPSTTPGKID